MKKSSYDHRPSVVESYDGNHDIVNLNIKEVEREMQEGEKVVEYTADTIIVEKPATYPSVVDALVRERYSVSDELAILRQKESKAEEFTEYNAYVEECKRIASVLK